MLTVSSGFKTSIKQPVVKSDGKIDIINANGTLSFDSGSISKIEVYGSAFQNDKVLGNIAQHSLTLEILGNLTKSISLSIENTIKPYIGVDVGGVFEYVQYQDFLITEISYSDTTNLTKILATDSLVKLNKEYTDINVYPLTLKAYLENVLTSCGLSLENTTFFNSDFVLTEQKIANLTLARDIVSKVAELALCFVSINKASNKVQLLKAFEDFTRPYTHQDMSLFTHEQLSNLTHLYLSNQFIMKDENVDKKNYWDFKLNDHYFGEYGINTLTLKNSQFEAETNSVQDNYYVSLDGNVELSIADNPFINTEALRLSIIDLMFNEVKNYKYKPYSLEYIGFPYLELGDIVEVTQMEESFFGSPIYEMTLRYDGGLYGKVGAKALSKSESKYYNTQTVSNRVKHAEIVINKVQGEVTIMAGDYYDGKLSGAKYVFDGTNATFYGGGLKIKNNALEDVFYADVNGNLTLTGNIQSEKDNVIRVKLTQETLTFLDQDSNTLAYMWAGKETYLDQQVFYISSSSEWNSVLGSAGIKSSEFYQGTSKFSMIFLNSNSVLNSFYGFVDSISYDTYTTNEMTSYKSGETIKSSISTFVMTNSSYATMTAQDGTNHSTIDVSNSQISLYNTNGVYKIYLGGVYKTISADANGFLKAT